MTIYKYSERLKAFKKHVFRVKKEAPKKKIRDMTPSEIYDIMLLIK